jgi:hypothetical protein
MGRTMTLYDEAVMRGMPEGMSDEEESKWWYRRDRDRLAVVNRLVQERDAAREENAILKGMVSNAIKELAALQANYCDALGIDQSVNGVAMVLEQQLEANEQ